MSKALKLFVIKDSSGAVINGDDGEPLYFDDKMRAKDHKGVLGGNVKGYTVSPGPDHKKGTVEESIT